MRNSKTAIDKMRNDFSDAEKQKRQEFEDLRLACKEVFATVNGQYILRFLKEKSFWDDDDMNVNHDVMVYKKGRRDMWLILRELLPKDVLAQIEIYGDRKD